MIQIFKLGLFLLFILKPLEAPAKNTFNQVAVKGYELNSRIRSPIQDESGFIWFSSKNAVWRFDGYQVTHISDIFMTENADFSSTRFIYQDHLGTFWIGTHNGHLYKIHRTFEEIKTDWTHETAKPLSFAAITEQGSTIWVATQNELLAITGIGVERFPYPNQYANSLINSLVSDDKGIYLATSTDLIYFSTVQNSYHQVQFTAKQNPPNLRSLQLIDQTLWLATDQGVYTKELTATVWQTYLPKLMQMKIRTVASDNEHIWIATILNGLFRVSKHDNEVKHFINQADNMMIASNEFTDILIDQSGLAWFFHFGGAVEIYDNHKESMGFNALHPTYDCSNSSIYFDFLETIESYWFLTENGITKLSKNTAQCKQFAMPGEQTTAAFVDKLPLSITNDNLGNVWIGSTNGLLQINKNDELLLAVAEIKNINKIMSLNSSQLLAATDNGVYLINPLKPTIKHLTPDNQFKNVRFNDIVKSSDKQYYFASSDGLFFTDNLFNKPLIKPIPNLSSDIINSLTFDQKKQLWIGTQNQGLYVYDPSHSLLNQINLPKVNGTVVSINALLTDEHNQIWASSNNGLYQFNEKHKLLRQYRSSNGLQGMVFNLGSAYKTANGQLFFGGRNGYNAFYPEKLDIFDTPPKLAITELSIFSQKIIPNMPDQNFDIDQDINQLNELTLTHRDYVIGFEFSSLSFANPAENQYQYMLEGFDPNWNIVDADNRTATYTNLPSGQFKFKIKGSNYNGIWNTKPKVLNIKVLPPPWLTWWALTSYVLLFLGAIYGYIQRKIMANQKMADLLRLEVAEKTKELSIQKQTVESLLAKKNELFSNVSHEFRTPLTLILGPIKELLNKQTDDTDISNLKMVKRNANRLLSLVEQLLQIARVSDFQNIQTTATNTKTQVQSLVDSFQHMAQSKKINLQLKQNDLATINVSEQFIDTVLGNLLSNAIKYTPSGGSVHVNATTNDEALVLSVKDTGGGLTATQQLDIFKRFKRLESHQLIEGIGIGLSVVEEVVKVNNGVIQVNSELGTGSEFTVTIPLYDTIEGTEETAVISTLVQQLQVDSAVQVSTNLISEFEQEDNTLDTILVIEDNQDMREHIVSIIKPHYNCFTAENGVKGVATAIKQIPDIIISDVMMPEMDGFKVARVIRSDQRTSHIPLMLLTALSDTSNRIKGWRENVDAYMTKPFDRDELLVQLNNMLTIRDILKKKAGQSIKACQSTSSILPKRDQDFVNQLNKVIAENYHNPILNRMKIAQLMAVSDRQLQRKLKALIDQNPMDMLREFRLNKSKELLKDGYQVSRVADDCGFNSLSYFSQCFKAQFGLSPKQYQQTTE